ncbi:MAG: type VI secretion system contractile sheath large subunit [Deltaproteobacteria bacterium]|jgi:type VI secretion system protein ImpC|nr:type VI secretion system contractile sheath large subunit [Deltaproteobacteria bacterium]
MNPALPSSNDLSDNLADKPPFWADLLLAPMEGSELAETLEFVFKTITIDPENLVLQLDSLIAGLDECLSNQFDAILHCQPFMALERSWRSLKFLVDRVDDRENIIIHILNAKKSELYYDLADAPEIISSEMFHKVYSAEYGQFGGQPFGVMIGAFEVSSNPQDMTLLRLMSYLGAIAHAPFLVSVGCGFFGLKAWKELPAIRDLDSIFNYARFPAWASLRNSENSRYLALVLPGFLARLPYTPRTKTTFTFNYLENIDSTDDDFVWGFSSLLLGLKMAESFAKYRWCANITGADGGGLIDGLPMLEYESMGRLQSRIPLQALISEKLEQNLANNGFISVALLDSGNKAAIYSAPTVLMPKSFGPESGGFEATFNYRVSTLLPYMMIINRLAHYIKVLQRENIGTWKDRHTIEKELNAWLNQYVTDMDSPSPALRSKRPLRAAKVEVSDLDDVPGWRQMSLKIKPHLRFMGASFTLSLVGRLDELELSVN